MAASATFALKAGEWFRRGRLFMVSPVRGDHRRFQAEIPLIVLCRFPGPALFRYPFCPGIPSSPTPGSSIIVSSSAAMSTRPSPRVDRLGTPKTPAIRFTRAMTFVASWFTHLLRSASLLAPCTDLTGCPASGAFTSGLPAGWSPFPLQDITTTATGLLCWRDSHPLEWQLASLHLLLHRKGLAPSTPCRSPGASQIFSALPPITDILGGRLARLSSGGRECFHSISNIPRMPLGERPARA